MMLPTRKSSRFRAPSISTACAYLKKHGLMVSLLKTRAFLQGRALTLEDCYSLWIRRNEPRFPCREEQRCGAYEYNPTIAVVVIICVEEVEFFKELVDSLKGQAYETWELHVFITSGVTEKTTRELEVQLKGDDRIMAPVVLDDGRPRDEIFELLERTTGELLTFADPNSILPPFALSEVVRAFNDCPDTELIYSDEDEIGSEAGQRSAPKFKPDFSPDHLRSLNYIGHLCVFRRELLLKTGTFCLDFDGAWYYDLILRTTEHSNQIGHIPKILYHGRNRATPKTEAEASEVYLKASARTALTNHLQRIGHIAKIEDGLLPNSFRVRYLLDRSLRVSIIIINKDNAGILRDCVNSVMRRSTYKNYEIIIVDNQSSEPETFELYESLKKDGTQVAVWGDAFNFAKINNFAVGFASGGILLFLNNDTEVISPDWLERMLEHAQRQEIGAVGAKLYYYNETVQHAGIIVSLFGGYTGHAHRHFSKESPGYCGRLKIIQNVSAVTGACLMVRKELFTSVGGFDETTSVNFSDTDLCLRLRENGLLNVWTPYAELYHHESKTLGDPDDLERRNNIEAEGRLFIMKWKSLLEKGDPYYNCNLSPESENFSLNVLLRSCGVARLLATFVSRISNAPKVPTRY